jgi:hypothetical protein
MTLVCVKEPYAPLGPRHITSVTVVQQAVGDKRQKRTWERGGTPFVGKIPICIYVVATQPVTYKS